VASRPVDTIDIIAPGLVEHFAAAGALAEIVHDVTSQTPAQGRNPMDRARKSATVLQR
jgi:hypothetical protein